VASGKVIFFGTPPFVLPYIQEIENNFQLAAIVTGPDQRGGRNNQLLPHKIKEYALKRSINLFQPASIDKDFIQQIQQFPADIGVVVAYGKILPAELIDSFPKKIINLHFSLLPRYRGAAPLQRAIINGDTFSGFTIFELTPRLDNGPIYFCKKLPLPETLTYPQILQLYVQESVNDLQKTIDLILHTKLYPQPQDESLASFAPRIKKEEGKIDFKNPAIRLFNLWRALQPWPEIFFYVNNKQIIVKELSLFPDKVNQAPGEIVWIKPEGMLIACANSSAIIIKKIKPAGKKEMTPFQYNLGNKLPIKLC